jgi:hypothetical protein
MPGGRLGSRSGWAPGSGHTAACRASWGRQSPFSPCTTSTGAVTLLARKSERNWSFMKSGTGTKERCARRDSGRWRVREEARLGRPSAGAAVAAVAQRNKSVGDERPKALVSPAQRIAITLEIEKYRPSLAWRAWGCRQRLELLKKIAPGVTRALVMAGPDTASMSGQMRSD